MNGNTRNHGYPDFGEKPTGIPVVKGQVPIGNTCPNCGCESLFSIEVPMDHPKLKGGKGIGTYVGCPACPWASPMVTRVEK